MDATTKTIQRRVKQMTISIQIERLEPTTSNGEGLRIIQTYNSFDKAEIDKLEDTYRKWNNTVMEVIDDE